MEYNTSMKVSKISVLCPVSQWGYIKAIISEGSQYKSNSNYNKSFGKIHFVNEQ